MERENNFFIDELTLLTGNDIIFSSPPIYVHQPTCKEIGIIGQINFYSAAVLLTTPKRVIQIPQLQEQINQLEDFDLLIAVLNRKDKESVMSNMITKNLLLLLFPAYTVSILPDSILLLPKQEGEEVRRIDNTNFKIFQQILLEIFHLGGKKDTTLEIKKTDGEITRNIKEKLRKRHEILNKRRGSKSANKMDIISRPLSIVSIGMKLSINEVSNFTVAQLFNLYDRQMLKDSHDFFLQRATSFGGVKKNEKIEDWRKDLDDKTPTQ